MAGLRRSSAALRRYKTASRVGDISALTDARLQSQDTSLCLGLLGWPGQRQEAVQTPSHRLISTSGQRHSQLSSSFLDLAAHQAGHMSHSPLDSFVLLIKNEYV